MLCLMVLLWVVAIQLGHVSLKEPAALSHNGFVGFLDGTVRMIYGWAGEIHF